MENITVEIDMDEYVNDYIKNLYEELKECKSKMLNINLIIKQTKGVKIRLDHILLQKEENKNLEIINIQYCFNLFMNNFYKEDRVHCDIEYSENGIKNAFIFDKNFKICENCFDINEIKRNCQCNLRKELLLNQSVFKTLNNMKNDNVFECSICLESINPEDICHFCNDQCRDNNHFFHLTCISKIEKAQCPLCKVDCEEATYKGNTWTYHNWDDE